jgi:hypothetical protein
VLVAVVAVPEPEPVLVVAEVAGVAAGALVPPVAVLELEPELVLVAVVAVPEPEPVPVVAELAGVAGATADVTGAVAEVTGAAAEVASDVTGATAEVTGAAAGALVPVVAVLELEPEFVLVAVVAVLELEPVLVVAEVAGVAAGALVAVVAVLELEPVPVVAEVAGAAAEATDVAAEVTGVVAEVTADVTCAVADVVPAAAEVTVLELAVGTVAAWACRESTSKMTKIPAATIATCTTRQAMCRKIDCGMSSSRSTGRDRIRPLLPIISGPKHAGRNLFWGLFRCAHPEPEIRNPSTDVHTVRPPPYSTSSGRTRAGGWRLSSSRTLPPQIAI